MTSSEINAGIDSYLKGILEPLGTIIFNEIVVKESMNGWDEEMFSESKSSHYAFRKFLSDVIREQQMSGTSKKTFSRLWMNEFHDRLWMLRKKVAHHFFLNSDSANTVLNISKRIIGEIGSDNRLHESELISRVFLIDWFHCTRSGQTLTGMNWFMGCDERGVDTLRSPEWELLKSHFASKMLVGGHDDAHPGMVYIPGTISESKRFTDAEFTPTGKDALDIILIKTRVGPAPWKPTFPVKSYMAGYKSDFNKLDLEKMAIWFPQSKVYDPENPPPEMVKNLVN